MNYVVPSRALRNLKSIGMEANIFDDFVEFSSFVC